MLQRDQFPFTVSDPSNSITLDGPLRRSYIPLLCTLGRHAKRERNIYEGGYGTRRLSDCFVCSSDVSYNTVCGVCFPLSNVSRPLEEEVVLERLLLGRGLLESHLV